MADLTTPVGVVLLGGRSFRAAEETTARQDDWILCEIQDAGLEQLSLTMSPEQLPEQMLLRVMRAGKLDRILAAILVEDGVSWTPAIAERNAVAFAALTSPEDKRARRAAFVGVLARFFWPALVSPPNSRSSSEILGANDSGGMSAASDGIDPAGASVSGATSFASSPGPTPG